MIETVRSNMQNASSGSSKAAGSVAGIAVAESCSRCNESSHGTGRTSIGYQRKV